VTGLGLALGLLRLRLKRGDAAAAEVPPVVPEEAAAAQEREQEPVLTVEEAATLSALAEARAHASPGAVRWGEILAEDLRAVLPDRVADIDVALVLLQVAAFLNVARESQEDDTDTLTAAWDGLRFGAAELAELELSMLATEEAGER
jgi:phage tail protein X